MRGERLPTELRDSFRVQRGRVLQQRMLLQEPGHGLDPSEPKRCPKHFILNMIEMKMRANFSPQIGRRNTPNVPCRSLTSNLRWTSRPNTSATCRRSSSTTNCTAPTCPSSRSTPDTGVSVLKEQIGEADVSLLTSIFQSVTTSKRVSYRLSK